MEIITVQKRRLQLLKDTIYYYSVFPRCLMYNQEEGYVYSPLSGDTARLETAGDALGRLLEPTYRSYIDNEYGEIPLEDIWEDLPEYILELGTDFLTELCCLHDNCDFWEGKTLSEAGREFVEEIKEKFIK